MNNNNGKKKHPGGASTKYDPEHYVPEIQKMAEFGVTIEDMSDIWGIAKDTIYQWMKKHQEFSDAFKKGVAQRKLRLRISLIKQAYKGNIGALALSFKIFEGWKDGTQLDLNAIRPIIQIIEGEATERIPQTKIDQDQQELRH